MQKLLTLISLIVFVFAGCDKDEIHKGQASVKTSFTSAWECAADFQLDKENLVLFRIDHQDQNGLIYSFEINYIPFAEDSFKLNYVPALGPNIAKANFYVMVDEDAFGDHYQIDTSNLSILNWIVFPKGRFQVNSKYTSSWPLIVICQN